MRLASSRLEEEPAGALPTGRTFLKDEAYQRIKAYLFNTEGVEQALSERALASRLELSLGPVRSALERLRVEGLISVTPNSGIRLPEVTAREIIEFYEFRLVVESHIVVALAGRLSAAQTRHLESIIAEQEETAAKQDTDRYHQLDLDFHTAFVEFYGNSEMVHALGRLRNKMYRLARRMHRAHPERLILNAAQHRRIMEAVRDGQAEAARERMEAHLSWGRSFTLDPDGRMSRR
jgi:DNA-binding GntR family transcriptional regulator